MRGLLAATVFAAMALGLDARAQAPTSGVGVHGTLTPGNCIDAYSSNLLQDAGSPCGGTGDGITVGTTTISGGTTNGLLYDNAGVLGNLATADSGVLITSSGGAPSISTTLPSGLAIPSPTLSGTVATGSSTITGTGAWSAGSLALGGAAIGSNQLALTGSVNISDSVNGALIFAINNPNTGSSASTYIEFGNNQNPDSAWIQYTSSTFTTYPSSLTIANGQNGHIDFWTNDSPRGFWGGSGGLVVGSTGTDNGAGTITTVGAAYIGGAGAFTGVLSTSNTTASTSTTTGSVTAAGGGGFVGALNVGSYIAPGGFTVTTLPISPPKGATAYVTDAVACTFLASLTGGGSTYCPVSYNGAAWTGG